MDMLWIKRTKAGRGLSAKTAACMGLAVLLVAGAFASSAAARDDNDNDRQRSWHDHHRDWQGPERGYYRAPPVVYDRYSAPTYYAPPPLVYGPSYGSVPGLTITIQ
jgi:hypothetical protein